MFHRSDRPSPRKTAFCFIPVIELIFLLKVGKDKEREDRPLKGCVVLCFKEAQVF